MPYTEIVNLQKRIEKIKSGQSEDLLNPSEMRNLNLQRGSELSKKDDVFHNIVPDKLYDSLDNKSRETELDIFGKDLFNNKKLSFEPSLNIPTPQNYQLGPGDELVINIWGASQEDYRLQVSPEGYINISNLAPIQVSGLTMEKAGEIIKSRLANIYSGMKGLNPNTFAEVTIGNVRSIKINIAGEIKMPGTYTLPSLASAFNALYLAGGPGEKGSYRNISVIRENKRVAKLDLYDFLLHGLPEQNIRLQDQDIIFVNPYQERIRVEGEVKRPAIYEAVGSETIADVLRFAGGFNENAYKNRIKILRNSLKEKRILDIPSERYETTVLQDGDDIIVGKILSRYENRVIIKGAVYREGEYELTPGMTLNDLIQLADGLREDAFLPRASIYRLSPSLRTELIPVNLNSLNAGPANDILLQREDIINISSIFDLEESFNVSIKGDVKQPGEYPWVNNMTLGNSFGTQADYSNLHLLRG